MKRKDFYFFRHGETNLNVRGVWQGCGSDVLLNANGMKQAQMLAMKIKNIPFTGLYCSSMLRAIQTVNIVTQNILYPQSFTVYPGLCECNFGIAEGMTFDESKEKFGKELVFDILNPTWDTWNLSFPGGESKHEVFERVMNSLTDIIEKACYYQDEKMCVGIVCHAGVLSAMECGLGLKNVSYDNCSILHLECEDFNVQNLKQVVD